MILITGESVNHIPFDGPTKVLDRKGSSRYHTPYSVLETNRKYYDKFCRKNQKAPLTEKPRRDQLLTYLWAAKSNFIFHGRREAVTEVKCTYYMKYDLVVDVDITMRIDLERPETYVVKNALSLTLEELDEALNIQRSDTLGQMIQDTIIRLMFQHVRIELQYLICGREYAVGESVMFSHRQYDGRFSMIYDDPDPDEEDLAIGRRYASALRRFHKEMHASKSAKVPLQCDSGASNVKNSDDSSKRSVSAIEECKVDKIVTTNSDLLDVKSVDDMSNKPISVEKEDKADKIETIISKIPEPVCQTIVDHPTIACLDKIKSRTDTIDELPTGVTQKIEDDVESVLPIVREEKDALLGSYTTPPPTDNSKEDKNCNHLINIGKNGTKRLKMWRDLSDHKDPNDLDDDGLRFWKKSFFKKRPVESHVSAAQSDPPDQEHYHYWLHVSMDCVKTYINDSTRKDRPPLYSGYVVSSSPMDQRTLDTVYSRYTLVQQEDLKKPSKKYIVYKRYKKTDLYTLTNNDYRPIEDPGKQYVYVPHIYEAHVHSLRNFYTKFLWSPFCVKGKFKHKWDGSFNTDEMRMPNSPKTYIYGIIEPPLKDYG